MEKHVKRGQMRRRRRQGGGEEEGEAERVKQAKICSERERHARTLTHNDTQCGVLMSTHCDSFTQQVHCRKTQRHTERSQSDDTQTEVSQDTTGWSVSTTTLLTSDWTEGTLIQ